MKSTKAQHTAPARSNQDFLAEWEQNWLEHWSKAGTRGYELPKSGPAGEEAVFLTEVRSVEKEIERLENIHQEFVKGFRELYDLGPAVTVFGSARFKEEHPYYRLAREVGAELARAGFATLTGGGPGVMEAANRGAFESGGKSYGLNILLPWEQTPNSYVQKNINFNFFFARKVMLTKYSCAFVVMPGGLGTLDELFEAATLIQCRKLGPFPVVMLDSKFWKGLQIWGGELAEQSVFEKAELGFGRVTDSPQEAVELIVRSMPRELRKILKAREAA